MKKYLMLCFNLLKVVCLRIIDIFIPKDDQLMVFYSVPNFSDNAKSFYDYMVANHRDYKLVWLYDDLIYDNNEIFIPIKKRFKYCFHLKSLQATYTLMRAKFIIVTHSKNINKFINVKKHTYIQLWHGMPIKLIGPSEEHLNKSILKNYLTLGKNSYFFSTSDIFRLKLSASFFVSYNRIFITGQPRTDCIINKNKIETAREFLNASAFNKIILFTPTYKERIRSNNGKRDIDCEFNNIFYMNDYKSDDFNNYLQQNNILFIVKPHPFDELAYIEMFHATSDKYKQTKDGTDKTDSKTNIRLLLNLDLIRADLYLYDLFPLVDIMATDFSSISIDFLIQNKPIIYLDNLADEYKKNRGFFLDDNYKILTPGPFVKTYRQFIDAITNTLECDDFVEQRNKVLPLLHKYIDGNASHRVFNIITNLEDKK
ncbi:MAG: CDP-glycerol glycerophosphotransferase family protein [Rickettsiales bacterium]|jgi:CDP-glycerol glycerophosphotransferase (TagB/SpsB family)|nr:CDP-glycerol glycerophosphotransferase family protein [Rickettsiales bacterium]